MSTDFEMELSQEETYEMEYIAAAIKPEQVKDVTPGWDPVPVTPDPGCVLSRVNVAGMPEPTEVAEITENGNHNVARKGIVRVQVPQGVFPAGVKQITENGPQDVTNYAGVDVQVSQGVFPSGVLDITVNGDYDVTEKAGVHVAIPQGVFPSGVEDISVNGDYDVTGKAGVHVAVPQGVFPSGTKTVTTNGVANVREYDAVDVQVPEGVNAAIFTVQRKRITVAESFSGTLNQALAALYNLYTEGEQSVSVNVAGMLYVGLASADSVTDQLVSWGNHYNSGVRSVARKYNASGQVVIQSNPAVNSYSVVMPAGAVYDIIWMQITI